MAKKFSSRTKSSNVSKRVSFTMDKESFIKLEWYSKNDKKKNVIDFNMKPTKEIIKIEDSH